MPDIRKRKKKKIWLIPVCAGVIAATAVGFLIWTAVRPDSGETSAQTVSENADTGTSGTIQWKGKNYRYNDHLSNYLLMGVDNREKASTTVGQANAGQADAIYLVSWDRVENTVTMISIPRDTMTEIQIYGPGGKDLGTNTDHISLSYAYGDGSHKSCRLTEDAVSNLMYGLPIQGYCSINMDALPVLTESVGTLTVTVPNSSLQDVYPEFAEGSQVTLTPENTEPFVRYRDIEESQSALHRMERQQEFIRAYSEAAKSAFAQDPGFAADLYTSLEPYMVTSMGNDEFVSLMESAAQGQTKEGWTIPGEGVEGGMYDEYHVDDNALYEKMIETFYKEAE